MFNKYLMVFLSVFILSSCGSDVENNNLQENETNVEINVENVENDKVVISTWWLSASDQEALDEFEKDLDDLFSELEDE